MSLRSALIVLIRIIVLYLSYQYLVVYIPALILGLSTTATANVVVAVFLTLLVLALPVAVYWQAARIVDRLAPKGEQEHKPEPITFKNAQALGFSLIGIFILFLAARETAGYFSAFLQNPNTRFSLHQIIEIAASWAFGLVLFVGSQKLSEFWNHLRRVGTE